MTMQTQPQTIFYKTQKHAAKTLGRAYKLVYEYFQNKPYTLVVRASHIAAYHKLKDDHHALTVIGWALNDMVRRGFLEKNGRRTYMVTEKFEKIVFDHGFQCMSEIGPCGYYASDSCPFRRGEIW